MVAIVSEQTPHVRRIEDLPKSPFRITYLILGPAGAKVTNETFAEVGRLEMLSDFGTAEAAISNVSVAEITAAPKLDRLGFQDTPLSPETI